MTGRHVMLDLETFGTRPGSVLRSVGAVVFGLRAGLGEEFYHNIERQSQLDAGLTIDAQTESWWARQSADAQAHLTDNTAPLATVAALFHAWFARTGGAYVWCQGANFDAVLWEAACAKVGIAVPWRYFNVRDTRTVYDICGFDAKALPRDGTFHNALDDAKHQARCIQAALSSAAARSPAIAEATWS